MTDRDEALKALDDIFNYCEEIDYSIPENERSGYKMLPDIQKIRKYIIENTRPHGKWIEKCWNDPRYVDYECSVCKRSIMNGTPNFCSYCGADMRKERGDAE